MSGNAKVTQQRYSFLSHAHKFIDVLIRLLVNAADKLLEQVAVFFPRDLWGNMPRKNILRKLIMTFIELRSHFWFQKL
jgi:hypothetical protein